MPQFLHYFIKIILYYEVSPLSYNDYECKYSILRRAYAENYTVLNN